MSLRIAIIGGGFSGVALAANIHRLAKTPVQIYLIDRATQFAQGLAYSTKNSRHLLNVRAQEMSAFADDPDHFVNWLQLMTSEFETSGWPIAKQFYARELYGKYLQDILQNICTGDQVNVELIVDSAVDVIDGPSLNIVLQSGRCLTVDKLVLAHGHILPKWQMPSDDSIPVIQNPWQFSAYQQISNDGTVLIVGTGLTMVDAFLQLKSQQHQGQIYALSRHGLLPAVHEICPTEYLFDENILSMSLRDLFKYVRKELVRLSSSGLSQQGLFRALRLQANKIWNNWTMAEKQQFMRHLSSYWDRQRHRIAIDIAEVVDKDIQEGILHIQAGRIAEIEHAKVRILPRHSQSLIELKVSYIINCSGPGRYTQTPINPIIDALLSKGAVMPNAMQLGLQATTEGAIIDQNGQVSDKIFTLGPPLKGLLFESTAVKEISRQSYTLGQLLLA